ncbi:hypothetical protein LSAT2_013756, partial [Lamellibrachia satsuma]
LFQLSYVQQSQRCVRVDVNQCIFMNLSLVHRLGLHSVSSTAVDVVNMFIGMTKCTGDDPPHCTADDPLQCTAD